MLAKYAPTPEVTFTAEARGRETNQGDRFLRSLDDPFMSWMRRSLEPELLRLGIHAKPSSNIDLLAVATTSQLDFEQRDFLRGEPDNVTDWSYDTVDLQVQGVYQFELGHVTAGASISRLQGNGATFFGEFPLDQEASQATLYAYSILAPTNSIELTLGISYDTADDRETLHDPVFGEDPLTDLNFAQLNPKLGIRAEVTDELVLRGAVFRTSKRQFVSDQTLEPTTIAGFAQFFDDFDWTDAWTGAAGVDFRAASNVWVGAEYLYRSVDIPAPLGEATYDGEEQGLLGYANATVGDHLAVSAGVQFSDNSTEAFGQPAEVRTSAAPGRREILPSVWFFCGRRGNLGRPVGCADRFALRGIATRGR